MKLRRYESYLLLKWRNGSGLVIFGSNLKTIKTGATSCCYEECLFTHWRIPVKVTNTIVDGDPPSFYAGYSKKILPPMIGGGFTVAHGGDAPPGHSNLNASFLYVYCIHIYYLANLGQSACT